MIFNIDTIFLYLFYIDDHDTKPLGKSVLIYPPAVLHLIPFQHTYP